MTRIAVRGVFVVAGVSLALAVGGCGSPPAVAPDARSVTAPESAPSLPTTEPGLRAHLAANPTDTAALARLSRILWDGKRHEDGVAAIEQARAAGTSLDDALLTALALHHDALGHADVADSLARLLEQRVSDWSREGSAIAYLRLRGDTFEDSEAIARRALDANPSAANHNNLGIALLYAGRPADARKSFLTAVDLDPELPGPLYNLAIVDRFYRFDEESAREWFRKYRTLSADDPDGLAELLSVKVAAGRASPTTEENP